MIEVPKTLEEAQKCRYGILPYDKRFCAVKVVFLGKDFFTSEKREWVAQCNHRHGPSSLYCKQHAKIVGQE